MDFVVQNQIKGITTNEDFLLSIDYTAGKSANVRNGLQSFRAKHAAMVVEVYSIDGNYLLNKKHLKMFTDSNKVDPITNLKAAVQLVQDVMDSKKQRKK